MGAGRPSGEKNRCGGRWTQARFNSFIKSGLRGLTRRWAPINDVDKAATTKRGFRMCAGCNREVPVTEVRDGKRQKNTFVDHIKAIVDPETGFTTWDDVVERMFCEADNLQVLCYECHTEKSNEERAIAKERRQREKENNNND